MGPLRSWYVARLTGQDAAESSEYPGITWIDVSIMTENARRGTSNGLGPQALVVTSNEILFSTYVHQLGCKDPLFLSALESGVRSGRIHSTHDFWVHKVVPR